MLGNKTFPLWLAGIVTLLSVIGLFAFTRDACAQALVEPADGKVIIPWGQWLAETLTWVATGAAGVAAFILRHAPADIANWLMQKRVDTILARAIEYAANTTAGAVKGGTYTAEIGNEVAERAVQRVVDVAPNLARRLGPHLWGMVVTRLDIDAATRKGVGNRLLDVPPVG